jgi:hypothetical protein
MGFSHVLRLCLQGGGVLIGSGTVTLSSCTITGNAAYYVRAHAQKWIAPNGRLTFARCLQGGGVFVVNGATVTLLSCTISRNEALPVRAHLQKFPSPRWENALLTCPFRFSSFMMGAASNYQTGVRAICA